MASISIGALSCLLSIFQLINMADQASFASGAIDPTEGFVSLKLNPADFSVQRPYDVPQDERYSFQNGIHKLWVYSTDKPHSPTSKTKPRTEIRILGHDYSSGVWQFEGYGYVPAGTSGVSLMQIFGASQHATTLMVRVYDGSLTYYRDPVLVRNIYNKWFRLNVIHDVGKSVKVYIDGILKYEGPDRGGKSHYFKFGVYAQEDDSHYMESRWKDIKVLKKGN
ncbi:citrate-binding protein-like [Pistacia vera]|uniref:citrate-binding protein-like n=1 Tax=Pistacia vera TaxID=55513 RepID=UPI001262C198|nr:citrate-binding protein-like [Pistacia vera]